MQDDKTPFQNFEDTLGKLLEVNKEQLDEAMDESEVTEEEPEADSDQ